MIFFYKFVVLDFMYLDSFILAKKKKDQIMKLH